MTFRSVLLGLLLGAGIASFGWFNDSVLHQAPLAVNMIPTGVYGLLTLGLLLINPLLHSFGRAKLLRAEWAVIISLMLIAAVIPGAGLLAHFTQALSYPFHYNEVNTGWRECDVLSYVPETMLVDAGEPGSEQFDRVIRGLTQGLRNLRGGHAAPISEVPWDAWERTLTFWLPVIALLNITCICIALIVHRQWAHRERVRYPVAYFASELLAGADERRWPSVIYNPRFWLGFAPTFAILFLDSLRPWSDNVISVPLMFDFTAILDKFTVLKPVPDLPLWILRPRIVFVVIGFAYFISSEGSFSLGFSTVLYSAAYLLMYKIGINTREGSGFSGAIESWQRFGSYLGLAGIILYIGRRHYASVLARAFGVRRGDAVASHEIWAARLALAALVALTLIISIVTDLAIPLTILFLVLILVMFLSLARLYVELGLFTVYAWWFPVTIIFGLFGFASLGPRMLVILGILSQVVAVFPSVTMIAMASNAMRIAESAGVAPRRISPWMVAVLLLALGAGVFCTMYVQYNWGVPTPGWSGMMAAREPYNQIQQGIQSFVGEREGWESLRWEYFRPNREFLWSVAAGIALVLIASVMRLRYTWWPLHPLVFLVWGIWPLAVLGFSFFLGWAIKWGITHFGGGAAYQRNRPLFVGMIAGEFACAIGFTIWGLIYYLIHGYAGPTIWWHP
jgi:uncharacterized protein DUF6785/uncharacterized protein DUF6784